MSKLGMKVVVSYILIVLVTTFVFIFFSRVSLNNIIQYNNKLQVSQDVSKIKSMLEYQIKSEIGKKENVSNYEQDKIYKKLVAQFINTMNIQPIETNQGYKGQNSFNVIYFLDQDGRVFLSKNSQKTVSNLKDIEDKYDKNIVVKENILSPKDKVLGTAVIVSENTQFSGINDLILKAYFLGFLISMLVALIMALIFEIHIIGPIMKLRNNINALANGENIKFNVFKTSDELSEINEEFANMANKLNLAKEQQREFFQNTSHELKSPLMSIQGYSEAIRDGVMEGEDAKMGLEIIIDESRKLKETVNKILYLSRIDNKKSVNRKMQRKNLYTELMTRISSFDYVNKEKNIKIINNVDKRIYINSYENKVDMVFSNLISNSVRYAKSKIEIDSKIQGDLIRFFIRDDGQGFKEEDISKLFDRFYKGNKGNTGLGLAIVKTVVESVGGTVKAYNGQNGGAVIEIDIHSNEFIFVDNNEEN